MPIQLSTPPVTDTKPAISRGDPNPDRLQSLGMRLSSLFLTYERDRRLAEMKWAQNARQFLGIYDPSVEAQIEKGRSKAYPKLTRVKCVSMLSRLMSLLFPSSEKNWSVTCTAVPNLSENDLQMVLTELQMNADPSVPLEDKLIEMAIVEFARERSRNLEREIDDQLMEIGGSRQVDYISLCRKVLMSGIIYGMGVLKGPFIRTQTQRTWERTPEGGIQPKTIDVFRPQFDFTPVWDYYPDMSAKYLHQMDGQFQRVVLARHQLRALADRDDFFGDVIKKYLVDHPKGNYKQRTYEAELKAMGVQNNVNDQDGRKYEALVWDGYISAKELADAGWTIPEERMSDQIEAIVWTVEGEVIKADMNPWVQLEVDQKVNTYHHFIFEEDESTLTGNALPNIMRDSQMGVAASSRMLMDNAGVVCGPNLEINLDLLRADQDLTSIQAYKSWYREGGGPQDANVPAVRNVAIDSHMAELRQTIELFLGFADMETFVNPATGGDMSKGPSEPFRTATGASILKGDAALPFKDVVRNFDLFTQSVIGSIVAFNMQFNPKQTIQGDHQVVPRGATSLMAKEVRGMIMDNLAATLTPEDARYLNRYELLRERLASRDIDVHSGILCDKDEAKRRDQSAAQAEQEKADQMSELLRAEVRKILAEGVKNLTQSDKNAAAADAAAAKTAIDIANASMGALEGDINVNGSGDAVPASGADGGGSKDAASKPGGSDGPSPVQVANNPAGVIS